MDKLHIEETHTYTQKMLRKNLLKAKNVINQKIEKLKSLVLGGSHMLSRAPSFNTIPSSNNNIKMQMSDDSYKNALEESETDHNEVLEAKKYDIVAKKVAMDKNVSHRSSISNAEKSSVGKSAQKKRVNKENKIAEERGKILAEKMKELEMVDAFDEDHVMDIEEALHHYSLLTCPVYQDIVDKFFMDMYSEFLLPQPSANINNSMRRLHSMRM